MRPMHRLVVLLMTALGLLVPGRSHAQDKAHEQALALQTTIEKTISQAGPSIACVLVSRSDAYRRLADLPPDAEATGTLGDFDPTKLAFLGEARSKEERRKLDMADPGYVPESFGSGVVIDRDGLVLTNYHVIRDA